MTFKLFRDVNNVEILIYNNMEIYQIHFYLLSKLQKKLIDMLNWKISQMHLLSESTFIQNHI